jgi:hypothetical protein
VEERSRDLRTGGFTIAVMILLVSVAVVVWWFRMRREARYHFAASHRSAAVCLRVLALAEEDFFHNDRDGNGVKDYWTRDVAGLHSLGGPAKPIQLIDPTIAGADGAHPGKPHHGYYLKALEASADRSPSSFGFCAYPADYDRTGRWTFVVNEAGKIYRVDTEGKPIVRWAPDPATWTLVD